MNVRSLLWPLAISALLAAACGPEYPNDDRHRGATEPDCIACHFDRVWDDPDIPPEGPAMPPDGHWEGSGPDSHHEACLGCHDMR